MIPDAAVIPDELLALEQWVAWRFETREGKPTKVPYRADGVGRASSTDASTWGSFDGAATAADWLGMDGVGFVFSESDPYFGVDLDEELSQPERAAIVLALDTYTELSISGNGMHVIGRGHLSSGRHPVGLGFFDRGRYFVMTGQHVQGTPTTIEERQTRLEQVIAEFLPTQKPRVLQSIDLDDRDLLERAFAAHNGADFQRLYRGDTAAFPSRSEADLAFCRTAAFWTSRDPARIDAWLRSSGLMREKWERADYRERTIETAIAGTSDVYAPPRAPRSPHPIHHEAPIAEQTDTLVLRIVPLDEFAAVEEPGARAILGTSDNAVIPEGGDAMIYGDGGVGKTTLCIDLACHLAAGEPWLSLEVPRPARVLLVENEGPRPLFRRKLARKLAAWNGPDPGDRVQVLEEPWGELDFADPAWRAALARELSARETDLLIVGPLTSSGMEGAGTIAEARAFLTLVNDLRTLSERPVAILLVHHENKGGKVSGAWEGTGDTLLHLQQQGHGQVRLYFQKARWASEQHATTFQLAWAEGDSFELLEPIANRPEQVWATLEQFVLTHPGCSWRQVLDERNEDGTKIVRGRIEYLARRRDQMLEEGILINLGRGGAFALWHHDDPARPTLPDNLNEEFPREGNETGKREFRQGSEGDTHARFPVSRLIGDTGMGAALPPDDEGGFPDEF